MIIIKKVLHDSILDLIDIYDSANLLFGSSEKAYGNKETFKGLVDNNSTYIITVDNAPAGFLSYKKCDEFIELTSLYIKVEFQRMGLGKKLISFLENKYINENKIYVVKALNSATWALNFYEKNGYRELPEGMSNRLEEIGIKSSSWSKRLVKVNDEYITKFTSTLL